MQVPSSALPFSYVNGAIVPSRQAVVSAFDRGFLVADGIFETFHVVGGVPLSFEAHLQRLRRSAGFMRLDLDDRIAELSEAVIALAERNRAALPEVREAALRMTISRGVGLSGPPTVAMYMRRLTPEHLSKRELGVSLWTLPYTRDAISDLAQHKTLSYLASSLGQVIIAERTSDPRAEGLFVTTDGHVLEGSSSNIFVVTPDGGLVTPPVGQGVLPGTSRGRVLDLAEAVGVAVREAPIRADRMKTAPEVFITSSTVHIAPAVALDGEDLGGGRGGPVTRRLQEAFEASIVDEIAAFAQRGKG